MVSLHGFWHTLLLQTRPFEHSPHLIGAPPQPGSRVPHAKSGSCDRTAHVRGTQQLAIVTDAGSQLDTPPVVEGVQILIFWTEPAGAPPATPGPPMTYEMLGLPGQTPSGGLPASELKSGRSLPLNCTVAWGVGGGFSVIVSNVAVYQAPARCVAPTGYGHPGGKISEPQVPETCSYPDGKLHVAPLHGESHVWVVGFHVAPAGHGHVDVAPAALLSVNWIAGDVPAMGQGGGTKARLFDSHV